MADLIPAESSVLAKSANEAAFAKVDEYLAEAKSRNTLRAYGADWRHFVSWCESQRLDSLPAIPETVAAYVACHAGSSKSSTLERRLNSISYMHRKAGHPSPCTHDGVRETMKGIRRVHGSSREGKVPLVSADIRSMVAALPDSLAGVRDRALILLGFAGALRRSELTTLQFEDLRMAPEGLVVRIRRSKTDQEGVGQFIGISWGNDPTTCPVRSVARWLEESGIDAGPVFRAVDRNGRVRADRLSGYAVALIVKRAAGSANLPVSKDSLGAHSLRSGHATEAAGAGAEERSIMRQGRWRAERTVRTYIRHGSLFTENSSSTLGL